MRVNRIRTRTENTKRNILFSLINSAFSIVSVFAIRTVILYVLGSEYVGLSSLFDSILKVLNLAELGFSGAMVYSMYRPLAENNDDLVCALLNFYRKIYYVIGSIILIIGLFVTPFVPKLIHGKWPENINLYALYILYLMNTVVSYFFFAHKTALLNAIQRVDLIKLIHLLVNFTQYCLQIFILVVWKSFYLYTIAAIFGSIFMNTMTEYVSRKRFPQYYCKGKIDTKTKTEIKKQVSGLMILELSGVSRNSFDSIVLSSTIGLTAVAIYNNYYFIHSGLCTVFSVSIQAMRASVGNSIASETVQKNYNDFLMFQFIYMWLISWCTVCLYIFYQPVIKLWVGKQLVLSYFDMILFCIYFYVFNLKMISELYYTGCGLWWNGKFYYAMEAMGNLVLNIFLGKIFGISGILFATILTCFLFSFLARTNIVYKSYFKCSKKDFCCDHVKYAFMTILACFLTQKACQLFYIKSLLGNFAYSLIMSCIIPNIVFLLIWFKTKRFESSYRFIKGILKIKNRRENRR